MPVFNGEKYLKEAIDSVLNQTFKNFEFLIIDDGSSDNSVEVISLFVDSRIRLILNDTNQGVAFTRNIGLNEAKGEFLVWMDCDDLIDSDKFQMQLKFMNYNKEIGICGTWLERFNEGPPTLSTTFLEPDIIKASLFFKPAVLNATAMLRMSMIREANLFFDSRLKVAEDYDFFLQASFYLKIQNLPKKLYYYRASESSIMKKFENKDDKMMEFYSVIYKKGFEKLYINPTSKNLILHRKIGSTMLYDSIDEVTDSFKWLSFLKKQNSSIGFYDIFSFDKVLGNMFYFICKKSSKLGLRIFFFYLLNRKEFGTMHGDSIFKLFIRCLIRYNKF
ncbi:Glycosyltransferase involved in cell wall bisynthesis [Rhodonellum ikkaensis]|nr:Glycosyltransferase involved in cell wall bisynthesis [Rhodonellum ikkaensis]